MRVRVEAKAGVATLTLERPEARNALDLEMCEELLTAAAGFGKEVRVVFVRGAVRGRLIPRV